MSDHAQVNFGWNLDKIKVRPQSDLSPYKNIREPNLKLKRNKTFGSSAGPNVYTEVVNSVD